VARKARLSRRVAPPPHTSRRVVLAFTFIADANHDKRQGRAKTAKGYASIGPSPSLTTRTTVRERTAFTLHNDRDKTSRLVIGTVVEKGNRKTCILKKDRRSYRTTGHLKQRRTVPGTCTCSMAPRQRLSPTPPDEDTTSSPPMLDRNPLIMRADSEDSMSSSTSSLFVMTESDIARDQHDIFNLFALVRVSVVVAYDGVTRLTSPFSSLLSLSSLSLSYPSLC
jgi:hypothetical protein